jgi:hypothetical protein
MLGSDIRLSLRGARLSRMWRLLQRLPRLRTLLWWLWWRSALCRTLLQWLSGFRHCGSGRSALLPPRGGLLCRPHLLRLETRALGIAERAASLDPRPLRRATRILDRCNQGAAAFQPPRAIWRSPLLEHFKRLEKPGPSAPNENAQPWPGSLVRSARFCGN